MKTWTTIFMILLFCAAPQAEAQLFKKLKKKIDKKVKQTEQKLKKKIDKGVDELLFGSDSLAQQPSDEMNEMNEMMQENESSPMESFPQEENSQLNDVDSSKTYSQFDFTSGNTMEYYEDYSNAA